MCCISWMVASSRSRCGRTLFYLNVLLDEGEAALAPGLTSVAAGPRLLYPDSTSRFWTDPGDDNVAPVVSCCCSPAGLTDLTISESRSYRITNRKLIFQKQSNFSAVKLLVRRARQAHVKHVSPTSGQIVCTCEIVLCYQRTD